MTQKNIILEHFKKYRSITSYESFERYGILDLQKIVNVLRKTYEIKDEWIHTTNRYGHKVKFKRYYIEGEV